MKRLQEVYYHVRQPADYKNFWKLNEELSYITPFAQFKKKKNSAKIMMGIYMAYDPKSQLNNAGLSLDEIKKDLADNFFKDPGFDWKEYSDLITAYKSIARTKIEKELESYYIIIQERRQVAEDLDWLDDYDKKEQIISKHDKYLDKYNELLDSLKQERVEKLMLGDYTPSLLEMWALEKKQ